MHQSPFVAQRNAATCTVLYRNLVLSVWRPHPMTVAWAEETPPLVTSYAATMPSRKIGLLLLFQDGTPVPSAEVRKLLDRTAPRMAACECCWAVVLAAQGFGASMVRGVLTGLNALSRSKVEQKVFSEVPSAAVWMAPRLSAELGSAFPAEDIARTVRETEALLANGG